MRSALLCVFIALIIIPEHNCESTEEDDFNPTPIPLSNWHNKRQDGAGTLQEITKSDALSSVAAVPAHYWEDALRHSVYLTLVRDKIDQLIAKPDSKDGRASNDFDDHEIWDKIKTAPFDRRKAENTEWLGDVTMVARGRLLEENDGFRFAEDEKTQKCNDEKCKEGVKAYWYVKRVRQRDDEAMSGKYHYELTFSVTSHTSPKKKPYENAVRTYTVRETTPTATKRVHETTNNRPQRAIWVHKNIAPSNYHKNQHYDRGLDRIFSSLFSDEDTYDEPPPRYKQQNFNPQIYPQHSKTGYVTQSYHHHHNTMMPYPYNPPSHKYSRPSYQTALFSNVPPYADFDSGVNNAHPSSLSDHRYLSSNLVKTTRPAVLPTPVMTPLLPTLPSLKNETFDLKFNITDVVPKEPELTSGYKSHNKPRPAPMKISYFPDHVRPPVYNAPPGVFVTMDKKPFKPMPPLKLTHSSKPLKPKPIDFRPSPQIQFSNPDSSFDSSFRPITINYSENNVTTEKGVIKENNKSRRIVPNVRKSTKKQDKVKSLSTSTSSPDIVTVSDASVEDTDAMDWANVLGAFTKTTPIVTTKKEDKFNVTGSTTPSTAVTNESTIATEVKKINDITSSTSTTSTTTPTTEKPKKRTRPPPKFTKVDKNRKRKPATSRNTTITKAPEKITRTRTTQDLTAQASSAAVTEKASWKPKNKTTSTTPMTTSVSTAASSLESTTSTTGQTTTTQRTAVTQSTTLKPSSASTSTASSIQNEIEPSTIQPRNKNRYRQSTLMYKGTSVKHDRWNAITLEKSKTIVSNKFPRRKVSNFQGYSSSTQKSNHIEKEAEQEHSITTTINALIVNKNINEIENKIATTEATSDYSEEKDDENSQESTTDLNQTGDSEEFEDERQPSESSEEQESQDHNEYIFNSTSNPNENLIENHREDNLITTEQTIITSLFPTVKNKTKCKKKKNQQSPATEPSSSNDMKLDVTSEKTTTVDFLDELLDSLDETHKPINDTTKNINSYERQINEDDSTDIEEFLSSLETNNKNSEDDIAYDVELSDEFSPFNNDDDNRGSRNSHDNYGDYQDRYSILELMAME